MHGCIYKPGSNQQDEEAVDNFIRAAHKQLRTERQGLLAVTAAIA